MSHIILRPFIVKVSVLGYFPLYSYYMIIEIIMILTFYLIFLFNDNRGVRIRYQCSNTFTLCYNTDTLYTIHIFIVYL